MGETGARLGVGIDFGTTSSTIACFDGERHRLLRLDPGTSSAVMPIALYLDRAHRSMVGQPAIDRYLDDNQDRAVEPTREVVGTIEVTVPETELTRGLPQDDGAIIDTYQVHALTDQGLPGRLFRSTKRSSAAASFRSWARARSTSDRSAPRCSAFASPSSASASACSTGPWPISSRTRSCSRASSAP